MIDGKTPHAPGWAGGVVTAGQRPEAYPVHFGVDYPEVERTRLTVAFRLVLAIPALIVLGVVNTARALLYRPPLLLILCWFDWKPAASADSTTGCSCSGTSTADQRGTGNIAVAVVAIIG